MGRIKISKQSHGYGPTHRKMFSKSVGFLINRNRTMFPTDKMTGGSVQWLYDTEHLSQSMCLS